MRALALALTCALASQAQALSCMAPDPIQDFQAAQSSDDRWSAVVGRLDFDENRLPSVALKDQFRKKAPTDLRAQFIGESLGPDGFATPFQGNVTLRVTCIAAWCAQPQSGQRYLAYLRHEGGKRLVLAEPCGQWLYPDPAPRLLDAVHACFAGGPCEAGQQF